MIQFNNLTLTAAARILTVMLNQTTFEELCLEWEIEGLTSGSVRSKLTQVARIALKNEHLVYTENGRKPLATAIVDKTISYYEQVRHRHKGLWKEFKAGLRFDGFEVVGEPIQSENNDFLSFQEPIAELSLKRMLPDEVRELDFRAAESELISLLRKHDFKIALGHLDQAFSNFSSGHWASANAMMRSFYEEYLDEVARRFGYAGKDVAIKRREYLADCDPPFLLSNYNEPIYVQNLMKRMHPEGSHPGLSEEDDCTFRLQITLISARLFVRRFDQRVGDKNG